MMSRMFPQAVVVCLALIVAGASLADDTPSFAEPGYYVVIQSGMALLRTDVSVDYVISDGNGPLPTCPECPYLTNYSASVGEQPMFGMRAGHRWKHIAVELDADYIWGSVNSFNATVNTRWYPWTGQVQPYLIGGLGMSHVRPTITDFQAKTVFGGTVFAIRAGAGVLINLSDHIFTDLDFSYSYLTGPANDSQSFPRFDQSFLGIRVGVGYRFF